MRRNTSTLPEDFWTRNRVPKWMRYYTETVGYCAWCGGDQKKLASVDPLGYTHICIRCAMPARYATHPESITISVAINVVRTHDDWLNRRQSATKRGTV